MWVTVALVVAVVVVLLFRANARPPGLPPAGPFALPLIGNTLTFLFLTPKNAFKKFAKDHGGILSYKTYGQWSVLVSDPALMRAGMADPAMAGRSEHPVFRKRDELIKGRETSPLGIITTSGDAWKSQRRFTLRTLKDLGFGRSTLEPLMHKELDEILQLLRQWQGEKVDVRGMFNVAVVNVVWAITIGKRYSHDDPKLKELMLKSNKMAEVFNTSHPALRFPWLKKLFPNLSVIKAIEECFRDLLDFIEGEMETYRRKMAGKVDIDSYIGAYLHELDTLNPEEGDDSALSLDQLKANITELFLAGSDTTSMTLRWAIYLMATNPGQQRTMQEEMDRVVGRDNMPTLAHMDKLPYTMATYYEIQRHADVFPFGVGRQATKDFTMAGFRIPKGTSVTFLLNHSLSDPKYWKEPDKFRPEHFLTDDGKVFKPDHYMPFGSGKRVCLGESMARIQLFLFIASFMHCFTWRLTKDPVTWERRSAFTDLPIFTVYAVSRDDELTTK